MVYQPHRAGFQVYAPLRGYPFSFFAASLFKACLTGMLALVVFIFRIQHVSRLLLGIFFILNVSGLILFKYLLFRILKRFRWKQNAGYISLNRQRIRT